MSANLGQKAPTKLNFSIIGSVKKAAKKIKKRARESVLANKSGKSKKREPYPGDLAFGNAHRLFPDTDYDLHADQSEYDMLAEWKQLLVGGRSFIPPNRENCASAVVGNELYMFGGLGGGPAGRYNLLCALNFNTLNWRVEAPIDGAPPAPCCKHTMVEYGRSIYIYGGEGEFEGDFSRGDLRSTRHILNKMYKYNTLEAKWYALPTVGEPPERRIPFARRSHSAVVVKNFIGGPSIIVWAGAGLEPIKARDRLFNDMWAFNIEKETWSFVNQMGTIPTPRSGHSATLIGNLMYVYGGLVSAETGDGTTSEMFCFDTQTLTWSEVYYSGDAPGGIYNHAALLHPWSHEQGKIVVFGGRRCASSEPPSNTVYCFDVSKFSWEIIQTKGRKPTGRFSMCAWTVRKCIVQFGGCNSHGYCNSDLSILGLPDPPFANIQDDIMARLSKMDSRDMLRGGDKGSQPGTGVDGADGGGSGSGSGGDNHQNSSVIASSHHHKESTSSAVHTTNSMIDAGAFSAIPESYDDPVPNQNKLRSYTPTMSYRKFKGVAGQGRSSLDCLLPTGELRTSFSNEETMEERGGVGGGVDDSMTLNSPSSTEAGMMGGGRSVSAGNIGGGQSSTTVLTTPAAARSNTAPPSGKNSLQRKEMGSSLSTPSLRPMTGPQVGGGSTLDGGASALPLDFMASILGGTGGTDGGVGGGDPRATMDGGSALGGLGGINNMQRPRSSLSIKDILTLGNGSFFVDQMGNEEEKSVLSDKTWIRQHLHRSYVRPRRLRSQGHIYLRGRDTQRKMALGEHDLPSLLPEGVKVRKRPTTSLSLARPKISATMLRRRSQSQYDK